MDAEDLSVLQWWGADSGTGLCSNMKHIKYFFFFKYLSEDEDFW